jgi:hypothetical protein
MVPFRATPLGNGLKNNEYGTFLDRTSQFPFLIGIKSLLRGEAKVRIASLDVRIRRPAMPPGSRHREQYQAASADFPSCASLPNVPTLIWWPGLRRNQEFQQNISIQPTVKCSGRIG